MSENNGDSDSSVPISISGTQAVGMDSGIDSRMDSEMDSGLDSEMECQSTLLVENKSEMFNNNGDSDSSVPISISGMQVVGMDSGIDSGMDSEMDSELDSEMDCQSTLLVENKSEMFNNNGDLDSSASMSISGTQAVGMDSEIDSTDIKLGST